MSILCSKYFSVQALGIIEEVIDSFEGLEGRNLDES